MNSYNVYEKLYANTKAAFTIVKNDKQYSLGEYMRMKSGNKNLAAEKKQNSAINIVSTSFSNIKEKLNAKAPKAKTIRKFPLRTAASALFSALIVCSLVLSFGAFSDKSVRYESPVIVEPENVESNEETSYVYDNNVFNNK